MVGFLGAVQKEYWVQRLYCVCYLFLLGLCSSMYIMIIARIQWIPMRCQIIYEPLHRHFLIQLPCQSSVTVSSLQKGGPGEVRWFTSCHRTARGREEVQIPMSPKLGLRLISLHTSPPPALGQRRIRTWGLQVGLELCSHGSVSKESLGISLVVQWLRFVLPMQGSVCSVPDRGTKIPHTWRPKQKKPKSNKQKQYYNIFNKGFLKQFFKPLLKWFTLKKIFKEESSKS